MTINKGVTVKILGKDYQVNCPEEQTEKLLSAALTLDTRMKEIRTAGRVIGAERIAVMAALNFAHEVLRLKEDIAQTTDDTEKRLAALHEKLASVLNA